MSEKCTNSGPNVGLLLLIPTVAVVAHMAKRRHRMLWGELGGPGSAIGYRGHGHHGFAGPGADGAAADGFRLPPRIEWILDTWHTRAHAADAQGDTPSDAPTDAPSA